MAQEREDYMRRQAAEHDMIRMRDPSKSVFARQVGAQPDPRDEMIRDLANELENWDNWFFGFNPDDRHSRMEGRQVIIRTRALLSKVRGGVS